MDFTLGSTWAALYYVSEWVIRLVMLVVIPVRRSPEAAKGWLLLVMFLPWVGLILYHVIGRPRYPRWRVERFGRVDTVFRPVRERLAARLGNFRPELSPTLAPAAELVQNL